MKNRAFSLLALPTLALTLSSAHFNMDTLLSSFQYATHVLSPATTTFNLTRAQARVETFS